MGVVLALDQQAVRLYCLNTCYRHAIRYEVALAPSRDAHVHRNCIDDSVLTFVLFTLNIWNGCRGLCYGTRIGGLTLDKSACVYLYFSVCAYMPVSLLIDAVWGRNLAHVYTIYTMAIVALCWSSVVEFMKRVSCCPSWTKARAFICFALYATESGGVIVDRCGMHEVLI